MIPIKNRLYPLCEPILGEMPGICSGSNWITVCQLISTSPAGFQILTSTNRLLINLHNISLLRLLHSLDQIEFDIQILATVSGHQIDLQALLFRIVLN